MFDGAVGFFDVEIDIEDARLFQALTSKSLDNSQLVKIPKFCYSATKFLAWMVKPIPCFDVWLEDYP